MSADPDGEARKQLVARFLRETAHLGPEGQARVLKAIIAANQSKTSRTLAAAAIEQARLPLDDLAFVELQARAYLAKRAILTPVDKADGPIYWSYPGTLGDYQLFMVDDGSRGFHLGASNYLMVHKTTGQVYDLGSLGE